MVQPPAAVAPPALRRGSETILLVEDDALVRKVVCSILRRNGYNVLDAASGGEALLISSEFPAEIHLLLTDVVMPQMNGRDLADQLAPQRPGMGVLFTSGHSDDTMIRTGVLNKGMDFLQKPYTHDGMLRKLREVLDD
jgi:two-component system cell cycle sensor histidine kinase/response regulator CckA